MIILGGGPVLAGWLNGFLENYFISVVDGQKDFSWFWFTQALIGLVTTIFLVICFRDETADLTPDS